MWAACQGICSSSWWGPLRELFRDEVRKIGLELCLPYELIEKISNRIINEIKHISRVAYDVVSKPPAMIEWK